MSNYKQLCFIDTQELQQWALAAKMSVRTSQQGVGQLTQPHVSRSQGNFRAAHCRFGHGMVVTNVKTCFVHLLCNDVTWFLHFVCSLWLLRLSEDCHLNANHKVRYRFFFNYAFGCNNWSKLWSRYEIKLRHMRKGTVRTVSTLLINSGHWIKAELNRGKDCSRLLFCCSQS